MTIRFLKPYGLAVPGDVKEVRWTVASLLIKRGVAEEVPEDVKPVIVKHQKKR